MAAAWETFFTLTCRKFVMPGIGLIDADNPDLSEEKLKKAYDRKCPYVLLTPKGIEKYEPSLRPIVPEALEPVTTRRARKPKTDEEARE